MRWFSLCFWIVLCLSGGFLGSQWTAAEIPTWYKGLVRPAIAPPNWLFAPAWTLLYLLMAVAIWQVLGTADLSHVRLSLALFLLQLGLNFAWSWIFFARHQIGLALVEIVLLWLAIGATTFSFRAISPLAAGLMLPYWVWVSFASVLNEEFWRLNR